MGKSTIVEEFARKEYQSSLIIDFNKARKEVKELFEDLNTSRYVPSSVIGETNEGKMIELLKTLEDSKTINMAYHVDDPNVGMPLSTNFDKFKMFVADTGLFVTLAFWDKAFRENIIYTKLLNDKLSTNLGYVYENLAAQMLTASGNRLFITHGKRTKSIITR